MKLWQRSKHYFNFIFGIIFLFSLASSAEATQSALARKSYLANGGGGYHDTGPQAAEAEAKIICSAGMTDCVGEYIEDFWDTSGWGWWWRGILHYTASGQRYSEPMTGSIYFECPTNWSKNETKVLPVLCSKPDDVTPCLTCNNKQAPTVGNPVQVNGGLKEQSETDYENQSGTLRFVRTYRGDDGTWRHNYQIFGVDRNRANLNGINPYACIYEYSVTAGRMWCYPYYGGSATFNFSLRRGAGRVINFGGSTDYSAPVGVNDKAAPIFDANGNWTGWRVTNANNDAAEYFNAAGFLDSIVARNGQVTTFTYSDSSTPQEVAPKEGLLLKVTDPYGQSLSFTYDSAGRMASMIDPGGNATTYAYDSNNNPVKVTYPDGSSKTYVYNELDKTSNRVQTNLLTGIIDENNNRFASFSYGADRKTLSTEHAGGVEKYVLSYPYATQTDVTDPLNAKYSYGYSERAGMLRSTSVKRPSATGTGTVLRSLDYDANGNISVLTDFDGTRTSYTYDLARNLETKRVEAYTDALARTISTEWHASYRIPSRIAEPLRRTTYTYDTAGNMLTKTVQATTDATGAQGFNATLTGTARTWTYTYSLQGQLLTVKGPRTDVNDTTTYTYDEHGNLVTVTNALGHVVTLSNYDAHGRAGRITDANGLATDFTYTARGWLSSITVGNAVTSYSYDSAGLLTSVTATGSATLYYTYDAAHRLIKITDSDSNSIQYTLDAMGNRISEQVADANGALARQIARVYDTLNRVTQISGAEQ